ncbi:uncharacterized protein LOC141904985 isoform X2 [Tubulanus polymorphus]|uniref:uncharacterized protein LOC141904985 isoform X2 n=1 Tax=Tubulanus polymorphus TaxID=672921 RepID=UPI003DA454F9
MSSGNAERERKREEARLERLKAVQNHQIQQQPRQDTFAEQPIFDLPVQRKNDDKTSRLIKSVLGDYSYVQPTLSNSSLIGVTRTPITPCTPIVTPRDEPFPLLHESSSSKTGTRANGTHHGSNGSTTTRPDHRLHKLNNKHYSNGVADDNVTNDNKPSSVDANRHRRQSGRASSNSSRERSRSSAPPGGGRSRSKSNDAAGASSRGERRKTSPPGGGDDSKARDSSSSYKSAVNGVVVPPNGVVIGGAGKHEDKPKLRVSIQNANKYNSHSSDLEFILKEMKVNPPLTAINTPRKDESKFSFPAPKDILVPSYHNRGKAVQSPIHRKEKPVRSDSVLKNDLIVSSSSDESDLESQPSIKAKRSTQNKRYSRSSANNASDSGSESDSGSSCEGETSAPGTPHHGNNHDQQQLHTPQRSEDEDENEKEDKNNSPWNLENVIRKINEETAPAATIGSSSNQTDQCNNVTSTVKESSEPQVTSSFPDDVWDYTGSKTLPSPMDIIKPNGLDHVKQEVPESTVNEAFIARIDSDDCEPDASNIRASGPSSVDVASSDGEISASDCASIETSDVKVSKISPNAAPSTTTFNLCHNNNNNVSDKKKKSEAVIKSEPPSSRESPPNLVTTFISSPASSKKPRSSNSTPKKETKKRSKKVKLKTYLSSDSDSSDDDVQRHDSKTHQMFIHSIKDMYVPERIAPLKPDSTESCVAAKNTPPKQTTKQSPPSRKHHRVVGTPPEKTPTKKSKVSTPKYDASSSPVSNKSRKTTENLSPNDNSDKKPTTERAKIKPDPEVTLSHVFDSVIGSTQGAISPLPQRRGESSRRTHSSPRKPYISPVRKLDFDQTSPGHRKARPPDNDNNKLTVSLDSICYKANGRPSIVVHLDLSLLKWIPGSGQQPDDDDDDDDDDDEIITPKPADDIEESEQVEEFEEEIKETALAAAAAAPVVTDDTADRSCSDMDISDSDREDGECSSQIENIQAPTFTSVERETLDSLMTESKSNDSSSKLLSSKQLHDQTMQQVLGDKSIIKPMPKIPKRKHNNDDDNRDTGDRKRFHGDRSPPKYHPADTSDRDHEDDHEWDRKQHPRIRDRRGSTSSTSSRISNRSDGKRSTTTTTKYSSYDRSGRRESRERDYDRPRASRDRTEWDRPDDRVSKKEQARVGPSAELNGNIDRKWMAPDTQREEKMETADYYLIEAKKLKHQADSLMQSRNPQGSNNKMDKLAKSLMYVEAVLSFIQCGIAMEHDRISVNMKIFTMFKDTLNLLIHICRFGGSRDPEISYKERKLNILSLRIQSLLCLKLYKLKRKEAGQLKKAIDDYNKQPHPPSVKPSQAPSPYQTTWNRSTGTPSPMSPTPSPASVGSVGSQGSGDCLPRLTNGNMTSTNSVIVPHRIHSVTQQYIQTIDPLHQCHNLWDQADTQALEFKDFFRDLNFTCGELTLSSSLQHLVKYVRHGLHWLKDT